MTEDQQSATACNRAGGALGLLLVFWLNKLELD